MAAFVRAVNANIPPLALDVADIRKYVMDNYGVNARQAATNMTVDEQTAYITNVKAGWFVIEAKAQNKPSNHRAQRNNKESSTWGKWVLLNALYTDKVNQYHQLSSSPGLNPLFSPVAQPATTNNEQEPVQSLALLGAVLAALDDERELDDAPLPAAPLLSAEFSALIDARIAEALQRFSFQAVAGPTIAGLLTPLVTEVVDKRLADAGVDVPEQVLQGDPEDYIPRPF
ncbi:hypothetical protein GGI35DRAFT_485099 [Trichoderma velutinum]